MRLEAASAGLGGPPPYDEPMLGYKGPLRDFGLLLQYNRFTPTAPSN